MFGIQSFITFIIISYYLKFIVSIIYIFNSNKAVNSLFCLLNSHFNVLVVVKKEQTVRPG